MNNSPTLIQQRNIGIDLLRGFSILLVVLLHLNIRFKFNSSFIKETLGPKFFSFLFWNGHYGVVIFFTLSGFLITHSVLKKWGTLSNISLKRFYWLRFSRIMPSLLALISILSLLHLFKVEGFVINAEQSSLWRAIFATLTFHFNWLEIQVGYLPANWDVLWSISVEEGFYLVFPLLCLFLKKRWQLLSLIGLLLLFSPWARANLLPDNELSYKSHLDYLDSISFGCLAAVITSKIKLYNWLNTLFLIVGWAMIILIIFFKRFVYQAGIPQLGLNITILSVSVTLVLFWMHARFTEKKQRDFIALRWLRKMGMYSYEIYLTHMFSIIFGVQLFKWLGLGEQWLIPASLLIVWSTYLLGKLVFHQFSEPMNQKLRKVNPPS